MFGPLSKDIVKKSTDIQNEPVKETSAPPSFGNVLSSVFDSLNNVPTRQPGQQSPFADPTKFKSPFAPKEQEGEQSPLSQFMKAFGGK
jgi:hypothetical protein